jgi:hypothetical protein
MHARATDVARPSIGYKTRVLKSRRAIAPALNSAFRPSATLRCSVLSAGGIRFRRYNLFEYAIETLPGSSAPTSRAVSSRFPPNAHQIHRGRWDWSSASVNRWKACLEVLSHLLQAWPLQITLSTLIRRAALGGYRLDQRRNCRRGC